MLLAINNISANSGVHFCLVKNDKIRGISWADGPSTVSLHFILYAQLCAVRPLTKARAKAILLLSRRQKETTIIDKYIPCLE